MHGLSWDEKECVSALCVCVRSVKRREICRERERRGPFSWTGMNEMLVNIHFYSPPISYCVCVCAVCVCVATGCQQVKDRVPDRRSFSFLNSRRARAPYSPRENTKYPINPIKTKPQKTSASTYILYSGLFRHPSWPSREDNQVFW